jgi:hypothetical protein
MRHGHSEVIVVYIALPYYDRDVARVLSQHFINGVRSSSGDAIGLSQGGAHG